MVLFYCYRYPKNGIIVDTMPTKKITKFKQFDKNGGQGERGNIPNDVIHTDAPHVDHFWCLYGLLASSGKFLAFEGEVNL